MMGAVLVRVSQGALQARFEVIYPTAQATDEQVTDAILTTLHADAALGCGNG